MEPGKYESYYIKNLSFILNKHYKWINIYLKNISSIILINTNLEYIKHNRVRLKEDSQKKVTEIFKEYFENIKENIKGLKGYAIVENVENDRETIVLTFWETMCLYGVRFKDSHNIRFTREEW